MKNKFILGLNIYHGDSSACLMKNGEIIFAIEEERINRVKHWAGFPLKSIQACLDFSKISLGDINYIALNSNPFSNLFDKIKFGLTNVNSYKLIFNKLVFKKKNCLLVKF